MRTIYAPLLTFISISPLYYCNKCREEYLLLSHQSLSLSLSPSSFSFSLYVFFFLSNTHTGAHTHTFSLSLSLSLSFSLFLSLSLRLPDFFFCPFSSKDNCSTHQTVMEYHQEEKMQKIEPSDTLPILHLFFLTVFQNGKNKQFGCSLPTIIFTFIVPASH